MLSEPRAKERIAKAGRVAGPWSERRHLNPQAAERQPSLVTRPEKFVHLLLQRWQVQLEQDRADDAIPLQQLAPG